MRLIVRSSGIFAAAAVLALAGCGGNSSTAAPVPATVVVAGEYVGTLTDSVAGTQTAATTLSQHGTAIGGTLTIGAGTPPVTEAVALTISGTTLSGGGLMDVNNTTCAFAMSASYANNQITGTYVASSNCTGRSGSFTLTRQCTDPAASRARRPQDVVLPC